MSSSGGILKSRVAGVIIRFCLAVYFEVSCSRLIIMCRLAGAF